MAKFGQYEGTKVVREATECILTGAHVDYNNSVRERVSGTPYFYRVVNHAYHQVTDDQRRAWALEAENQNKTSHPPRLKVDKSGGNES